MELLFHNSTEDHRSCQFVATVEIVERQSSEDGYDTLEEVARGDIPEDYAREVSVAVSPDGRAAMVLLGTNEEPCLYPWPSRMAWDMLRDIWERDRGLADQEE